MLESTRASLCFIAQSTVDQADDDMSAVRYLSARLPTHLQHRVSVAGHPEDLVAAVAVYRKVQVLLASRLHAGLFALAAGVPSLVVGYEPKVVGVLEGLGLAHRVIPPDASWSSTRIAETLASLTSVKEKELTEHARALASTGFEKFDDALRRALRPIDQSAT